MIGKVELAARLGVTLPPPYETNGRAPYTTTESVATGLLESPEPIDLTLHPRVQAAVDRVSVPRDRSKDTDRIVRACKADELTRAQARWAVAQRPDLVDRLTGRHDDDIARIWEKIAGVAAQDISGVDGIRAFTFPDGHRPTDVGNAARLLHRRRRAQLRYVHAWGKWIVYQRGRWIIDEKDALVTEIAKEVAEGLVRTRGENRGARPTKRKPIWAWALQIRAPPAPSPP